MEPKIINADHKVHPTVLDQMPKKVRELYEGGKKTEEKKKNTVALGKIGMTLKTIDEDEKKEEEEEKRKLMQAALATGSLRKRKRLSGVAMLASSSASRGSGR